MLRAVLAALFLASALMAVQPALAGSVPAGSTPMAGSFEVAALDSSQSLPDLAKSFMNMPVKQLAAIGVGAFGGVYVAEMLLEGGVFSLIGAAIGGIGGNHWYEKRYWPF
ncbi:MAG: hypothetical protein WCF85_04175 [Rhodospirillaceae bacterium]